MHYDTAETLLAVITAFSAKFVVGNAISFVQKQCPILFPFLTHSRHINPPFRLKIKKPQERYSEPCFCHFSGRKSGKIAFLSLSKKSRKVFVLTCGYVWNCRVWGNKKHRISTMFSVIQVAKNVTTKIIIIRTGKKRRYRSNRAF